MTTHSEPGRTENGVKQAERVEAVMEKPDVETVYVVLTWDPTDGWYIWREDTYLSAEGAGAEAKRRRLAFYEIHRLRCGE